jgi:hypothetical protein
MSRKTDEKYLLDDVGGQAAGRRYECLVELNVIFEFAALSREVADKELEACELFKF